MGVLRWGSEYLFYIIHFFDIGRSSNGMERVTRLRRQGRKMWLLSQYCYVIMTSVIYYLVVTVGFIIALFPVVDWKNRWSSFYWKASDPKTGFDFEAGSSGTLPCYIQPQDYENRYTVEGVGVDCFTGSLGIYLFRDVSSNI